MLLFLFGLFSQLLEAQADYHRKSLTVLENVLPTIQAQQGNITCKQEPPVKSISRKDGWVVPVYSVSLQANFSCETQGNVPLGMLQIVASNTKHFPIHFSKLEEGNQLQYFFFPFKWKTTLISICQLQELLEKYNGGPNTKDFSYVLST